MIKINNKFKDDSLGDELPTLHVRIGGTRYDGIIGYLRQPIKRSGQNRPNYLLRITFVEQMSVVFKYHSNGIAVHYIKYVQIFIETANAKLVAIQRIRFQTNTIRHLRLISERFIDGTNSRCNVTTIVKSKMTFVRKSVNTGIERSYRFIIYFILK